MFADDLNMLSEFALKTIRMDIRMILDKCRIRAHEWGRKNRVSLDPDKEHVIVLHLSLEDDSIFSNSLI